MKDNKLPQAELLKLKRWNTPTIYNGWEQITTHDSAQCGFNLEETRDFMPQMGPMVGYALTVVCEPGNPKHAEKNLDSWTKYWTYLSQISGPRIVVVQDLDKPHHVGSFWGEVNSNVHKAFGCIGTITDGAIRDLDEMCNSGFKAIAKRMCVGHAYSVPIEWGCEVNVFGCPIKSEQLIHADKHGFLAIPDEDQERLYDAACFMDANECNTFLATARNATGMSRNEFLQKLIQSATEFGQNVDKKFGGQGEW